MLLLKYLDSRKSLSDQILKCRGPVQHIFLSKKNKQINIEQFTVSTMLFLVYFFLLFSTLFSIFQNMVWMYIQCLCALFLLYRLSSATFTTLPLNKRQMRSVQIGTLNGQIVPSSVIALMLMALCCLLQEGHCYSSAYISAWVSRAPSRSPDHETAGPYLTPPPVGPLWTSDPFSDLS